MKDGYDSSITEGFRTMFAYLEEKKRGKIGSIEDALELSLIVAEFSYSDLPKFFGTILGVTGTLKSMSPFKNEELERRYEVKRKYYIPSVYGDSSLRRSVKRRVVEVQNHDSEIISEIQRVHSTGRPVLVFFKEQAQMMRFFNLPDYNAFTRKTQILDETFKANERDRKIRDTGFENQISLMTDSFGRGTDFKISDKAAKLGGMHVIQTYLSEELADEIQVQGRTARQSAKGSYLSLITPSDL